MQKIAQAYVVEHDGGVTTDLDPRTRALLTRIARCGYMIDMHRRGIALNQERIREARAELEQLEVRQ